MRDCGFNHLIIAGEREILRAHAEDWIGWVKDMASQGFWKDFCSQGPESTIAALKE